MRSGINGALAKRPSIATNAANSTTPAAITANVGIEPQPVTSVRTMPSTSNDNPSVAVTAPARSKFRSLRSARPATM